MKTEISAHEITTMKVFMQRHIGSSNRVSPECLAEYMYGKPTPNNIRKCRQVRREINADATNDLLICTDRDEGGFYLADAGDQSEVERHIAEERSIAMKELEKVKAMEKKAVRLYPAAGQGRLL